MSNNIKVVCRFRPPNALELRETGGESIVAIDDEGTTVKLRSASGAEANGFTFDKAFPMDSQQVEVFEYGIKGIVDGAFSSPCEPLCDCSHALRYAPQMSWTATTAQYSLTAKLGPGNLIRKSRLPQRHSRIAR